MAESRMKSTGFPSMRAATACPTELVWLSENRRDETPVDRQWQFCNEIRD
jgi:hypothetical protein